MGFLTDYISHLLVYSEPEKPKQKRNTPETDNIHEYIYMCQFLRKILREAQERGIGAGEPIDAAYFDKYNDQISQEVNAIEHGRRCTLVHYPLALAQKKLFDEKGHRVFRITAEYPWIPPVNDPLYGDTNHTFIDMQNPVLTIKETNPVWDISEIKNIPFPKDGITGTDIVLKAIYNLNHQEELQGHHYMCWEVSNGAYPKTYLEYANMHIQKKPECPVFEETGLLDELFTDI